ncbi:MAG: glycosyltransferase family 4 protein [Bacteroidales bacterium]|nr:glycosyltransferase family 4 protein [Bacteroidales bacterium]
MRNRKDILFLCQFFYPEYISSATLPFDTAKALSEAGFSVGVLCGYPKEYNNTKEVKKNENHEGIEIKRLNYVQLKRSNFIGRLINYFSFTFAVALNICHFRWFKSVIVYSNPPILPLIAWLSKKIFKTDIIFVSYDVYPEIAIKTKIISESSLICKAMNVINSLLFNNVTKVVALSSEMKQYLIENRNRLNNDKVVVIPNWFEKKNIGDIEKAYKNQLFNALDAENNLVVSYFGNIGVAQDLNTLLEAIVLLKDDKRIKFVFAGHGNKIPVLKEAVKKNCLDNVFLFDYLHGSDFEDALNISDVFVVTMEAGLNGLAVPSKTYSYMMSGKPIVAIMDKNSDTAIDIVKNNAGFSIEVGDTSVLLNTLNILIEDTDKRNIMGKNAYKLFSDKFTKEKCTSQYIDLMKCIMEER